MIKRPYMIAELAKEHGGDMEKAKYMIRIARGNYFNAVKLQCYDLEDINNMAHSYSRYVDSHLTIDQLKELKKYSDELGIDFFCSVFSKSMIKPLSEFTNQIKIPSTILSWPDFVKECIDHFDKIHISTGFHELDEIKKYMKEYIDYAQFRHKELVFYNCTSRYPTQSKDLRILRSSMGGLSYHGMEVYPIIYSVLLGCEYVELHFVTSYNGKGWCWTPSEVYKIKAELDNLELMCRDNGKLTWNDKEERDVFRREYKGMRQFYQV